MSTLYKNLRMSMYIGLSATLLTACGAGLKAKKYNTSNGEKLTLGMDNPVCQEGDAIQKGRIIDKQSGKGLVNVEVDVAGCKVQTDNDGYYALSNIPSVSRVSVNVEKKGYMKHSTIISIDTNNSNYVEVALSKNKKSWSFSDKSGTTDNNVVLSSDTEYTTKNNEKYTGEIQANYSEYEMNTNTIEKLPGDYRGIDSNGIIVNFVSYALMNLELKDSNGSRLKSSEPITLNVSSVSNIKEDTIPLWYYNYDRGIWIEDGFAQKDENGNFICEISHTGTWSLSKPIETEMGMYVGRIVDANENPISHVRVKAEGQNWMNEDLTTDENGEFKLYVVPNKTFRLSAYDYKEKFGAKYTDTMHAISAGEVVEEN